MNCKCFWKTQVVHYKAKMMVTGVGMVRLCTSDNEHRIMVIYWCQKYESCNTITQQLWLFHHDTYCILKIFGIKISIISLQDISYNVEAFWYVPSGICYYIWSNLHGRQYPNLYSDPLLFAKWYLTPSVELDIFVYGSIEWNKKNRAIPFCCVKHNLIRSRFYPHRLFYFFGEIQWYMQEVLHTFESFNDHSSLSRCTYNRALVQYWDVILPVQEIPLWR